MSGKSDDLSERGGPASKAMLSTGSSWALNCAKLFADFRLSSTMDLPDLLGALCIVNADRLSKYWSEPEGFRRFVDGQPETGRPAQHIRSEGWEVLFSRRVEARGGAYVKECSAAFWNVFQLAKRLAVSGHAPPRGGESLVFPEHYLLALVEQQDLNIVQKLLASGLQVEDLKRDVERGIT